MKIIDSNIPSGVRKEHMKAIVAWANDRSSPATAEFGGVMLTKRMRGASVFIDPAPAEIVAYAAPPEAPKAAPAPEATKGFSRGRRDPFEGHKDAD